MKKFKKNIKPKTSKHQNKITKKTVPYVSSEPLHPNDICLYRSKASSDLAKVKERRIADCSCSLLVTNFY